MAKLMISLPDDFVKRVARAARADPRGEPLHLDGRRQRRGAWKRAWPRFAPSSTSGSASETQRRSAATSASGYSACSQARGMNIARRRSSASDVSLFEDSRPGSALAVFGTHPAAGTPRREHNDDLNAPAEPRPGGGPEPRRPDLFPS